MPSFIFLTINSATRLPIISSSFVGTYLFFLTNSRSVFLFRRVINPPPNSTLDYEYRVHAKSLT